MIEVKSYDLPDFGIFNSENDDFCVWNPERTIVVLGTSNTPGNSVISENILADCVEVYIRPSGGQAVVLTPSTLVVSVLLNYPDLKSPKEIFSKMNNLIIHVLHQFGVRNLAAKGISDIAIGEKKILGSSIYRKKEKHFYHAVLNVAEKTSTFERYLKHPPKEPDYRNGRPHSDFVTSLKKEGYDFSNDKINKAISLHLMQMLSKKY